MFNRKEEVNKRKKQILRGGNPAMPNSRRRGLTGRERRELHRMNQARAEVSSSLGRQSEESASKICRTLKKREIIKDFWPIPPNSALDWQGIDIICKTDRGFFFLNVKKSSAGVDSFWRKREQMEASGDVTLFTIYPWRVMALESTGPEKAERDLLGILTVSPPSAEVLSPEIETELTNPTLPGRIVGPNQDTSEEQVAGEETLTSCKKKLTRLLKKHGLTNLSKGNRKAWEARLAIDIKGVPLEIVRYSRTMPEAEKAAYRGLLEALKEKGIA